MAARAESLLPFDATVAAVVEEGSRLAGDQRKLTARLGEVVDLVGRRTGRGRRAATGSAEDVARAIERDRRDRRVQRGCSS